jgi:hypothetical protein
MEYVDIFSLFVNILMDLNLDVDIQTYLEPHPLVSDRFILVQYTKTEKNIPNDHKIYQMTTKYVYQIATKYTK